MDIHLGTAMVRRRVEVMDESRDGFAGRLTISRMLLACLTSAFLWAIAVWVVWGFFAK